MQKIIVVALGGGIGAVTRYVVSLWAAERFGAGFPYGTLIVNVVGCFIIGSFMYIATERIIVDPYWRLLVTTGFLGGLTTFSSFGYETIKLLESGSLDLALYNVMLNVILGVLATWCGISLGKLM